MDFQYNTEVALDNMANRIAELEKENAILKAAVLHYTTPTEPQPPTTIHL